MFTGVFFDELSSLCRLEDEVEGNKDIVDPFVGELGKGTSEPLNIGFLNLIEVQVAKVGEEVLFES